MRRVSAPSELIALLSSDFVVDCPDMARCWTGRIAVTQHIPGPSAHERRTPRTQQAEGSCRPGRGFWSAARLDQGRDSGSPGRFMDGRPWVWSVRGCRPSRGSGVTAPGGALRGIDHRRVPAFRWTFGPRRLRRQIRSLLWLPPRVIRHGEAAPRCWLGATAS
jgi:hypothetical protein